MSDQLPVRHVSRAAEVGVADDQALPAVVSRPVDPREICVDRSPEAWASCVRRFLIIGNS
ncbi:hypothetical protein LLG46_00830 [bacterium]|nr:hypothetical protein [bacterium]